VTRITTVVIRCYSSGVISDLAEIRRRTESNEAENLNFRRRVVAQHLPIGQFLILANDLAAHTDCTACANCCRHTIVDVSADDIDAIAGHLDMTVDQVTAMYTDPDERDPSSRVLRNRNDACVFLDSNLCIIYEARPAACRNFPHIGLRSRTVGGRLSSLCRRASVCPIIYNALEAYKKLVGYRAAGL
jgi:uncharacterized protein